MVDDMGSTVLTYQDLPPMAAWADHQQTAFDNTLTSPVCYNIIGSNQTFHQDFQDDGWRSYAQENQWMPQIQTIPANQGLQFTALYPQNEQTNGGDGKQKKRSVPSRANSICGMSPEELCLVCGDKASGYHYNALTCEGCKGFFRRSITRKALYYCKYGGHCDIDMYMRRKCQACRLSKCIDVGMRPELVIPEEQCRMKRESKCKTHSIYRVQEEAKVSSSDATIPSGSRPMFSIEQRELVHRLLMFQEQFELPSDEDLRKLTTITIASNAKSNDNFQHLAELIILNVQLIFEFTKHLPGFSTLKKEDQHILLKASSTEILMLKTARRYDTKSDTFLLGNNMTNWAYSRQAYKQAGMGSATDAVFEFAKSLSKMKIDDAEFAFLTAISVFSERPGLLEVKKVEDIQEIYTAALQAYIEVHRPKNRSNFARLLMKLTDLRTLTSEHADMLYALKLDTPIDQRLSRLGDHRQQQLQQYGGSPAVTVYSVRSSSASSFGAPKLNGSCAAAGHSASMEMTNTSSSSASYRVPNVRIKVEPLERSPPDLRIKPDRGIPMDTDDNSGCCFGTAQQPASTEHDILQQAVAAALGTLMKAEGDTTATAIDSTRPST